MQMRQRGFYLASLLLVLLAVGLRCGALGSYSQNVQTHARAATVTGEQRKAMYGEADRFTARGSSLALLGFCLALASSICLYVSFRRRERAWSWLVPIALLLLYAGLMFIQV
jgi:hypothetical protein